jgi:hypothetical protein
MPLRRANDVQTDAGITKKKSFQTNLLKFTSQYICFGLLKQ